ncbi:MAG: tetratricopeptide repeat protein [Spirosomaceae bacterium]|nr:tetratricopeptide repeat protein [Spirosomataceae bacterium]
MVKFTKLCCLLMCVVLGALRSHAGKRDSTQVLMASLSGIPLVSKPAVPTIPTVKIPKPVVLDKRFKQLNNAGVQRAYQGRFHTAKSLFLQAQEKTAKNDTLLYNLALTNGMTKDYDAALELMTQTGVGRRYLHNKGVWEAQKGDLKQSLNTWEHAPQTDTLIFNVALANYRMGDLSESQDWSKRIGFGKAAEFHELSANVFFRLGEYKQAEKYYEKAEKFVNKTGHQAAAPRLLVQRANAMVAQHQYEKAEELFKEYLTTKDPYNRYAAHLGLGHALYRQRKYQLAVIEYDAACRLNDYAAEAWLSLGHAYVGTNGQRQAQKAYERALAIDSTQKIAWLGLGMVFYRLRNFNEAVCCFDQAGEILNPRDRQHADFFAARAFCRLYTNQTPAAKTDVQTAVKLSGKGLLPCLAMSEYLRIEGYFLSSLKWLERAIRAHEEVSVRMLVNRANIYLKCHEYEDAFNDFQEAHRLDPTNVNATNGLAISYLHLDEIDQAKVLYDSLMRKKKLPMLYNNRGIVQSYMSLRERHERNQKDEQKYSELSMRDFEKGLELDSTKKAYFVNVANVYKNRDEEALAIEHYQKYLSKNAINNMGVLFGKGSRRDFSKHYLDIAIYYDTANTVYLYNRAKLFHDHFKDQYARRPDLKRAFKLMPTNDISLKYSPDGYVTIFMFDYEFETFHFPGEPLFDVSTQPIDDFAFLPSLDFIPMKNDGLVAKNNGSRYVETRHQLKYRTAGRGQRGKTKCPKM